MDKFDIQGKTIEYKVRYLQLKNAPYPGLYEARAGEVVTVGTTKEEAIDNLFHALIAVREVELQIEDEERSQRHHNQHW